MMISKLNIVVFTLFLLITMSCSVFKKSEGEVIKGGYKITKTEKIESDKCKLVCNVYDKKENDIIKDATVQIKELKLVGFTKNDGSIEFEIPTGKYKVVVANAGNTQIETSHIKFVSGNRIEIKFELGTTIIH